MKLNIKKNKYFLFYLLFSQILPILSCESPSKIGTSPNIQTPYTPQNPKPACAKPLAPGDDLSEYFGFRNLGNTCYANSANHAIHALPAATAFTSQQLTQQAGESSSAFDSRKQLQTAFHQLLSAADKNRQELCTHGFDASKKDTATFEKLLSTCHRSIKPGTAGATLGIQEDAAEYLELLLNEFEYNKFYNFPSQKIRYELSNKNIIIGQSSDPITLVPVPFTPKNDLQDSINHYFDWSVADISITTKIPNANRFQKFLVAANEAIPSHIIIQLGRFDYTKGKINTPLTIPDSIDIPFYDESYKLLVIKKFYLKTFVSHSGSMGGGHYTAYMKDSALTPNWIEFDDSYVHVLTNQEQAAVQAIINQGYLYLYVEHEAL